MKAYICCYLKLKICDTTRSIRIPFTLQNVSKVFSQAFGTIKLQKSNVAGL